MYDDLSIQESRGASLRSRPRAKLLFSNQNERISRRPANSRHS